MYQVIELKTGFVIGTYSTRKRARNKADKLDNAYGAYAYTVRSI